MMPILAIFTNCVHPCPTSMYVHALLSIQLTFSSFDSLVCKCSLYIYQANSHHSQTKHTMSLLSAITGLSGHHLIFGISLYHFYVSLCI
jgi:hypothetical protein